MSLAAELEAELVRKCDYVREITGYNPTAFKSMIHEHGGVGAVQRILSANQINEGLVRLYNENKLKFSIEATVLEPKWQELFTKAEIQTARIRLSDLGYVVEG